MKRAPRSLVVALLATVPLAQTTNAPTAANVDALFAAWDRPDTPGAAVAVVQDGKVVHEGGYGLANVEHSVPITPETVFDIASVSKQFAGLAIAMLVERGDLSLDDEPRVGEAVHARMHERGVLHDGARIAYAFGV